MQVHNAWHTNAWCTNACIYYDAWVHDARVYVAQCMMHKCHAKVHDAQKPGQTCMMCKSPGKSAWCAKAQAKVHDAQKPRQKCMMRKSPGKSAWCAKAQAKVHDARVNACMNAWCIHMRDQFCMMTCTHNLLFKSIIRCLVPIFIRCMRFICIENVFSYLGLDFIWCIQWNLFAP